MCSWHPAAGKIPAGPEGLLLCPPHSGSLAFCSRMKQKSPTLPFTLRAVVLPLHQHKDRPSPTQLCSAALQACFTCLLHTSNQRYCQSLGKQTPISLKSVVVLMPAWEVQVSPGTSFSSRMLTLSPLSGKFSKGEACYRQETGVQLCFKDSVCRSKQMTSI